MGTILKPASFNPHYLSLPATLNTHTPTQVTCDAVDNCVYSGELGVLTVQLTSLSYTISTTVKTLDPVENFFLLIAHLEACSNSAMTYTCFLEDFRFL